MKSIVAVLFVASAFTAPSATPAVDTSPAVLLTESFQLSKERADRGDTRTLAAMRLAATMRMAGMSQQARLALEDCAALVAKETDADKRDETKVELAREFLLLGDTARAQQLASELKEREYDLLAQFIFAREALEQHDAKAVEQAIRQATALARQPGRKQSRMGASMLCSLGRMALQLQKPDLARECEDQIIENVWKSALIADRAVALAAAGQADEALRVAGQAADTHMLLLAYARVAAELTKRNQSNEPAIKALRTSAARWKEADKREFALRVAAGVVAAAGDANSATAIAAEIQTPATRLLALCPFVAAASCDGLLSLLSQCSATDQPALAEVLAVSCGKRGLADQALAAAAKTPEGWPRVRTLCDAARLMDSAGASQLIAAAVEQAPRIVDPGWRCVARSQIGLAAYRVGNAQTASEQTTLACAEALRIEATEDYRAVLPQVIEAALQCGFKDVAAKTLVESMARKPEPALRDVLTPMLVEAGLAADAIAEVDKANLVNDYARRILVYRLAKAGRLTEAVAYADKLNNRARPEALCDIARAQLPDVAAEVEPPRRMGLSLHGGWMYWPNRLERAGIPWDVMPFSTAYEEGAAGLSRRYTMLGYPGAGDHHIQCSPAGNDQVRAFLRDGGGLFGICAGQLLATGHPAGTRFVPADFYYLRGGGAHEVQMAARHPAIAGLPSQIIITRRNGDFMLPRPGCDVLGWYDNENVCAAVIASRYGLGRVVVSSPHPEGDNSFSSTDRLCIEITRWILEGMQ